jgi:hypothetical protein
MTIIEAIMSGKPIKRAGKEWWHAKSCNHEPGAHGTSMRGFFDPGFFLSVINLTKEDILADDWEVEEKKVEVTKSSLLKAIEAIPTMHKELIKGWASDIAKEIGLD